MRRNVEMRRLFAFFSFVLCLSFVDTNCSVNEFKSHKTGLCCALCPAGKHRIEDCGQDYSTVCRACPENQFTATPNNSTSCENCTSVKCDSASGRIPRQCTPTSNSRCECPKNKYWHIGTLRCKDCKECSSGEVVKVPCKTYEDTECEKCPEGTYAANNICITCSRCQKGEVVLEECTQQQDTVCGIQVTSHSQKADMPTVKPTNLTPQPNLRTTRSSFTSSRSQIEKDDASKVAHSCEPQMFSDGVAWFLLGLVFLLSCIVLLLSWSKVKKFVSKRNTPTPTPTEGKVDTCIIAKPKSSELARTCIKENNIEFSSLPASVTEDLATHLNAKQGKNWKYLAGLMGYNSSFTQNLELEPLEATQRLLQDWVHSGSGTTVYKLYCLLQKIGRDDASAVLLPHLTPKSRGEEDV